MKSQCEVVGTGNSQLWLEDFYTNWVSNQNAHKRTTHIMHASGRVIDELRGQPL